MQQKVPLMALLIGTLGLIAGYAVVAFTGPSVFAHVYSCPMKHTGECIGDGCSEKNCANGECGVDCPGCANHE